MNVWLIIGIAAVVLGVGVLLYGLARTAKESDDRMDEIWLREWRRRHPYDE